jgi:hypothetical protein
MERRRGGGLKGKPFFQTGAAEGVQAVEEGERLIEEVGADLWQRAMLVGIPWVSDCDDRGKNEGC